MAAKDDFVVWLQDCISYTPAIGSRAHSEYTAKDDGAICLVASTGSNNGVCYFQFVDEHTFTMVVNFIDKKWMPWHVTIGLFEATAILGT